MTRILGVHGIGKYKYYRRAGSPEGAATALATEWMASLALGLPETEVDLTVAYYAHHLHRGTAMGAEDDPATLELGAQELLVNWVNNLMPGPAIEQGPRTARARQAADWVSRNYGAATKAFVVAFCREVHTYLAKPDSPRRAAARQTVAHAIAASRPDVVVAHSLGSVVTYEALWAHPDHEIDLLVTLGSPLAMPGAVLPHLIPSPSRPPQVRRWTNIADVGDIVAIPRVGLRPTFDGLDEDISVVIGTWAFHGVEAYLRSPDVAKVIHQR
jgi:hypothetical protein